MLKGIWSSLPANPATMSSPVGIPSSSSAGVRLSSTSGADAVSFLIADSLCWLVQEEIQSALLGIGLPLDLPYAEMSHRFLRVSLQSQLACS